MGLMSREWVHRRHPVRRMGWAAIAVLSASYLLTAPAADAATPSPPFIAASADWLTTVNYYRAMSGLSPVAEDPTLSAGARNHSRYMIGNGVIAHDEVDGAPFWTTSGDNAGNRGNVAVSSSASTTARRHVELWMTGPFHAIGILRSQLRTVGYGQFDDPAASPWRSGATLNIIDGLDLGAPRPTTPVLFPGDGMTTSLTQFIAESPNPLTFCGWTGTAGLPILALMPESTPAAGARIVTANGTELETCVLTTANTSGVARDILDGDNAVVVIPRRVLAPDSYHVEITTPSGVTSWSFTVDPAAAGSGLSGGGGTLPSTAPTGPPSRFTPVVPGRLVDTRRNLGATRLVAGRAVTVDVAGRLGLPAAATAVSANFTVVGPDADGYLTVFPCGGVPNVSTVNFTTGSIVPNQAVVPLNASGDLCMVASARTDVIVDVNGGLSGTGTERFTPVAPSRLLDTRRALGGTTRRAANTAFELPLRGKAGIPTGATAVALNVTAVDPERAGYVTVYPCGTPPDASNLNLLAGQTRPNLVVVRLSAAGSVCMKTAESTTDLLADVAGYFAPAGSAEFTPLSPLRFLDTRSTESKVNGNSGGVAIPAQRSVKVVVAGQRGVPAEIDAVSVNLTVTGSQADGYLTAYPCGAVPNASNVNFVVGVDTANAATIPTDASGAICLWASAATHMIVDINGVWN